MNDAYANLRKRAEKFVRSAGELPLCLGRYLNGDPECDGVPPCAWRSGCRVYKKRCDAAGIDPSLERKYTPDSGIVAIVMTLLETVQMKPVLGVRHYAAWERFFAAFSAALPRRFHPISPSLDLSAPGELYVRRKILERKQADSTWTIARRSVDGKSAAWDRRVCVYTPSTLSYVEPSIRLHIQLKKLLELGTDIVPLARRWTSVRTKETTILTRANSTWCQAGRVYPERIGDMGRLAARLLESGMIDQIQWEDQ